MITNEEIQEFRSRSFSLNPGQRVSTVDEAIEFVKKRGFIFFWPITGITMPSLWTAVAGDRPVADAHDDPGHVTWGWKDSLLGQRRWYYAKVLRKKATIIALDVVPYFYALSENYGSPEDDYLTLYEQGRLTQEAKSIYEAILEAGPIDTVALRHATKLTSRESDHRFNRSLTELQTDFKILPIGVAQAGGWNYAFIYEIVARHFPELPNQAHPIRQSQARQKLLELYFESVGAARIADIVKLFGWEPKRANQSVNDLAQAGKVIRGLEVEGQTGEWIALKDLL
jgi:hypothetical protein